MKTLFRLDCQIIDIPLGDLRSLSMLGGLVFLSRDLQEVSALTTLFQDVEVPKFGCNCWKLLDLTRTIYLNVMKFSAVTSLKN